MSGADSETFREISCAVAVLEDAGRFQMAERMRAVAERLSDPKPVESGPTDGGGPLPDDFYEQAGDRGWLRAECKSLAAEVRRLREEMRVREGETATLVEYQRRLEVERDRLRDQYASLCATLRVALADAERNLK